MGKNVVIDLSHAKFVDHTVMEKLHGIREEFIAAALTLDIIGLDDHRSVSSHPFAAKRLRPVLQETAA